MANRVIRDWTDSEKVDKLSFGAECFFARLCMKADDFGFYHANPKLLKAALFPLKDLTLSDISIWLTDCEKVELLETYTVNEKKYLKINNFGQRLRKMVSKFPFPPTIVSNAPPEEKRKEENPNPETGIRNPESEEKAPQTLKINIRDNVSLKYAEIEKLKIEFGAAFEWALDEISNYKHKKGATYKSDYHALIGWVKEKYQEQKNKSANGTTTSKKERILDELRNFQESTNGLCNDGEK